MAFTEDDPRLAFMPEADVLKANGRGELLRNRWFAVHPEKGLIFWQPETLRIDKLRGSFPQCNSSEAIAKEIIRNAFPWAELKFFDFVILPLD